MAEVDRMNRGRRAAAEAAHDRKRRKKRKKNRTLHYILITIFLLASGAALSLTVLFKIESVTAVGVDKYPPDDIVAESGIEIGGNMFRIDYKDAEERILKKFPYIDEVSVKLKLPHEVRIELTQCVSAGALVQGDEIIMITRDGKVLERGLMLVPDNIPLIAGVDAENAKPGDRLIKDTDKNNTEEKQGAEDALRILDYLFQAAEETGFGKITNVNLTDRYNIKIIYENRLLLNLGTESDLPDKLNFLKEAITNRLPQDAQGMIDASDASRSLNYKPMSLEDALAGKRHGANPEEPDTNVNTEDEPNEKDSTELDEDH